MFDADFEAGPQRPGLLPAGNARLLVATVDQTLTIVSHYAVDGEGRRATDLFETGRSVRELFPHEPLASEIAACVARVLDGETASLQTGGGDETARRYTFLPRVQDGARQRGFFLLIEDLSESEAVRREGEALRERIAGILRHAADVIIVASSDGTIEEANDAAIALLGWSPDELRGQPLTVLMDEPYRSAHAGHLARYLEGGRSGILNVGPRPLPARRRDGRVVAIELSVGEAWIAGERKFIGVCRGIGERLNQQRALEEGNLALSRKVQELQQVSAELEASKQQSVELARVADRARRQAEEASRAKSRFLATISHELRTPLNGVLAVADVLASRPLPPETRELTDIIVRSGQDLLALLNELLDLSRIESGALSVRSEPFSLTRMLQGLEDVWRVAAARKGLDLSVTVDRAPLWVVGDEGRLKQILSNLLNNAIKFTPSGAVALDVATSEPAPGYAGLAFTVRDTGPGIDAAARERLFQPFASGLSEQAREGAGAGLGLAISRELVALMRGAIRCDPDARGGAAFVVELELPLAEPAEKTGPSSPSSPTRPLRVLVAEDHPVNRQVIGLLLDQLGVEHVAVCDGAEAVAAEIQGGFDAILMDVRMPGMDGLAATRAIRKRGSSIPIVAVSADATADQEAAMRGAGMDDVLPKPIGLAGLAEVLSRVAG